MRPESELAAEAPPRRHQVPKQAALIRAQYAQDVVEKMPMGVAPDMWAGVGDSLTSGNFVMGSGKGTATTYSAASLLSNKVQ